MRVGLYCWAALLAAASGCVATTNQFQPGERVGGVDEHGHKIALYPLNVPNGVLGETKVWSRGATMAERDGAERAYLHVGFELHNTSAVPITMRRSDVQLLPADRGDRAVHQPLSPMVGEDLTVDSQATGEMELFFELPSGVGPRDLRHFVIAWGVGSGERRYAQETLFVEIPRYDPYPGYGAYFRGPYGYGPYDYWYYRWPGYCNGAFCQRAYIAPPRGARRPIDGTTLSPSNETPARKR